MAEIGELVRNGFADWASLGNGDIQLRLFTGETLHLGENSITRVGAGKTNIPRIANLKARSGVRHI